MENSTNKYFKVTIALLSINLLIILFIFINNEKENLFPKKVFKNTKVHNINIYHLEEKTLLFSDKNEVIQLSSLIDHHKTIILRITSSTCIPCYNKIFTELENLKKDYNFIIITPFTTQKDLQYFKLTYNIESIVYRCMTSLITSIDQETYPYIFTLDSNMKVSNLLILYNKDFNTVLNYCKN
ncbi:hypothetical protein [Parabacteroides pacaensis]|uniref:hypothetical protein n=1 Tax=Parabacteroides pacaensis TaxID=2086575 RepID=UPI00131B789C|nr:hypothetical protein [Parabacteroides pacaensis]